MTGRVYVSSEYEEVANDMKKCFLGHKDFRIAYCDEIARLLFLQRSTYSNRRWAEIDPECVHRNPFGCETERELYLRKNTNSKVYRWVFSCNELNTKVPPKPSAHDRISKFLMTEEELRQTDLVTGSESSISQFDNKQKTTQITGDKSSDTGGLDEKSMKAFNKLFVDDAEEAKAKVEYKTLDCKKADDMV